MKTKTKLLLILLAACMLFILVGCNKQIFDTNYTFNYAYITMGGKVIEGAVSKWNDYDNSDMVQVIFENGDVYYTHGTNVILCKKGK